MNCTSFPPQIYKDSRVLILGTMPGVRSLQEQQYYAHPQNLFWRIMFAVLEEERTDDYSEKLEMLRTDKIALWDTIETCTRKGSLDAAIRNEEQNDVAQLLSEFPNVRAVFCNGQKSYKNTLKLLGEDSTVRIFAMPSTSPAYAVMSFEEKLAKWSILKNFL